MKIGVVGGGPSGLLAAKVIGDAGYSVELFEENERVGVPRHCTGIISETVLSGLRSILDSSIRSVVMQSFREYRVRGPYGSEIYLELPGRVYVTDRVRMEEIMFESAVSAGVEPHLGIRVRDVRENGFLGLKGGGNLYYRVVLAEGALMRHSLSLGLCRKARRLIGIQGIVNVKEVPETVVIYALPEVSKDFFGWIVPYGEGKVIAGFADSVATRAKLDLLLKFFRKDYGIDSVEVKSLFGGMIPSSGMCDLVKGAIAGIGDSVGSVKPLTGGGLYPILKEVEALRNSVNEGFNLSKYSALTNKLKLILRKQLLLKELLRKLGGYGGIIRALNSLGVDEVRLKEYDLLSITSIRFL